MGTTQTDPLSVLHCILWLISPSRLLTNAIWLWWKQCSCSNCLTSGGFSLPKKIRCLQTSASAVRAHLLPVSWATNGRQWPDLWHLSVDSSQWRHRFVVIGWFSSVKKKSKKNPRKSATHPQGKPLGLHEWSPVCPQICPLVCLCLARLLLFLPLPSVSWRGHSR